MAWVAADRSVKAVERFGLEGPADRWRELRDQIHAEVCARGFDAGRNSFVQYYGGDSLDAALLLIPLVGFLKPDDPRMVGTVAAIQRELTHDGLVRRYPTVEAIDGLPAGEATFITCSYWLVDNLALLGRQGEAREMFEHLLSLRNDLGLLAEEYDPVERRQLGNFPQAFSHVGLINSAHNLAATDGPARERAEGA
jgi:GH15 family glucan-1,4-alpha-glucosidase